MSQSENRIHILLLFDWMVVGLLMCLCGPVQKEILAFGETLLYWTCKVSE